MSTETTGSARATGAEGMVSPHPRRRRVALQLAPTMAALSGEAQRNVVRAALSPVACMRLPDGRFEFDSSVLTPESARELRALARYARESPRLRPAVFGHADPVNQDAYNKTLSGRRAKAVYAALVRDIAMWEDLADHAFGGDEWGPRHLDRMLGALGFSGATRVRDFQSVSELTVDGDLGPITRRALFEQYMDFLCFDEDAGAPYSYEPADFLGRGGGKGDLQGCGELNPLLMLSQSELDSLSREERNRQNAPNRRVLVFFFPHDTVLDASAWPCPTVDAGPEGCQSRLWSDHEARRATTDVRRVQGETRDTFACRFYERLAFHSPCERRLGPPGPGFITFEVKREDGTAAANVHAVIRMPDGETVEHTTDAAGRVRVEGALGERFALIDVHDPEEHEVFGSTVLTEAPPAS